MAKVQAAVKQLRAEMRFPAGPLVCDGDALALVLDGVTEALALLRELVPTVDEARDEGKGPDDDVIRRIHALVPDAGIQGFWWGKDALGIERRGGS